MSHRGTSFVFTLQRSKCVLLRYYIHQWSDKYIKPKLTQTNGCFCVRRLCENDSDASIHQNTNDRFTALLLRPFPPLHRYYLLNFAATLELFNLASMKAWGKLWRKDLHPHAGKGKSYHGLTPCFSSKECLIRTARAGRWTRAQRARVWRCWVSVSMAALEEKARRWLSLRWHLIDRYVGEVRRCPGARQPYRKACQQGVQSKSVVTSPYEVSPGCEATQFLSAPAGQGRCNTWRSTKTTRASWPVLVK